MTDTRYNQEQLNGMSVLEAHYNFMAKLHSNLAQTIRLLIDWQEATQLDDYEYSKSDEIYLNSLRMQWSSLKMKIDETNQRAIEMGLGGALFGMK